MIFGIVNFCRFLLVYRAWPKIRLPNNSSIYVIVKYFSCTVFFACPIPHVKCYCSNYLLILPVKRQPAHPDEGLRGAGLCKYKSVWLWRHWASLHISMLMLVNRERQPAWLTRACATRPEDVSLVSDSDYFIVLIIPWMNKLLDNCLQLLSTSRQFESRRYHYLVFSPSLL